MEDHTHSTAGDGDADMTAAATERLPTHKSPVYAPPPAPGLGYGPPPATHTNNVVSTVAGNNVAHSMPPPPPPQPQSSYYHPYPPPHPYGYMPPPPPPPPAGGGSGHPHVSPNYGPVPPPQSLSGGGGASSSGVPLPSYFGFSAPPPPNYTASSPSYYSHPPHAHSTVSSVAASPRRFSVAGTTASSPYYAQSPSRSYYDGGPPTASGVSSASAAAAGAGFLLPPSSPRVDVIASVTHRIEKFVRTGLASRMLQHAEMWYALSGGPEYENQKRQRAAASVGGAASKLLPHTPPSYGLNKSTDSTASPVLSSQSITAGGTLDRFLKRRNAFALFEPDQIVRGIVYDKTDTSIVLTITDVYRTSGATGSTTGSKETLLQDLSELGIHGSCLAVEMQPYQPLPFAGANRSARVKSLAQRTAAEEQAELDAYESNNRLRKIAHERSQIERFSIGQFVKALIISVDPHSETIDLSLNNARLRGLYTVHTLGVASGDKPVVPGSSIATAASPQHSNNASPSASPIASVVPPSAPVASPSTGLFSYGSWSRAPYGGSSGGMSGAYPIVRRPNKPKPKARSFLDTVHRKPLFKNPEGLTLMIQAYNVNEHGSVIPRQAVPAGEFYRALRHEQNQKWAEESVSRGVVLARAAQYDNAIRCYQHALDIEPKFAHAYVAMGAAYIKQNNLKDAIKHLQTAIGIDPHVPNAHAYLEKAEQRVALIAREQAQRSSINVNAIGSGPILPPPPTPNAIAAANEERRRMAAAAAAESASLAVGGGAEGVIRRSASGSADRSRSRSAAKSAVGQSRKSESRERERNRDRSRDRDRDKEKPKKSKSHSKSSESKSKSKKSKSRTAKKEKKKEKKAKKEKSKKSKSKSKRDRNSRSASPQRSKSSAAAAAAPEVVEVVDSDSSSDSGSDSEEDVRSRSTVAAGAETIAAAMAISGEDGVDDWPDRPNSAMEAMQVAAHRQSQSAAAANQHFRKPAPAPPASAAMAVDDDDSSDVSVPLLASAVVDPSGDAASAAGGSTSPAVRLVIRRKQK